MSKIFRVGSFGFANYFQFWAILCVLWFNWVKLKISPSVGLIWRPNTCRSDTWNALSSYANAHIPARSIHFWFPSKLSFELFVLKYIWIKLFYHFRFIGRITIFDPSLLNQHISYIKPPVIIIICKLQKKHCAICKNIVVCPVDLLQLTTFALAKLKIEWTVLFCLRLWSICI